MAHYTDIILIQLPVSLKCGITINLAPGINYICIHTLQFHHSNTDCLRGNMSNCTEIAPYLILKYSEMFFLTFLSFIIIPWSMLGFYTCIKNFKICTNSKCNMDTKINIREVQKVFIDSG